MTLRIITGGQAGVDQAALRAARACGLETGGWAPLGWVTEDGPADWLAEYGLLECPEPGHPARRRRNVMDADTMILIGDRTSPGSIGLLKDWSTIGPSASWVGVQPDVP
jgi:Circularly permutated YpsA SLOG family